MACRSEQVKKTQNMDDFYFGTPIANKNQYSELKRSTNLANEQSTASHENKLPVNLFYTAAEYNKMLITNGRSIKKKSQPQIQGYMANLQFINDPIFQSCQQKKESLRNKIKHPANASQRKQANSYTQDCNCCCCDEYCKQCVKQQKGHNHHRPDCKSKKLNEQQLVKVLQKINSKPLKPKKKNKIKVITSETNIRKIKQEKDSKGISNSQKECSSSYLSHKSFNINNLLYKSLIQFQEKKRQNRINKLMQKQLRFQQENLMKQFDYEVRIKNRQILSRSKSQGTNKDRKSVSNSKKARFQYWQSIRPMIAKSLLKDKIDGVKPASPEKMSKSEINCHHAVSLTPDMIQTLKLKYEREAKEKIAKQAYQTSEKKKKIQKQLKQLQKNRKRHASSCTKKKFQPTPQMIEQAFKNIIEEPKQVPQPKSMMRKQKK